MFVRPVFFIVRSDAVSIYHFVLGLEIHFQFVMMNEKFESVKVLDQVFYATYDNKKLVSSGRIKSLSMN